MPELLPLRALASAASAASLAAAKALSSAGEEPRVMGLATGRRDRADDGGCTACGGGGAEAPAGRGILELRPAAAAPVPGRLASPLALLLEDDEDCCRCGGFVAPPPGAFGFGFAEESEEPDGLPLAPLGPPGEPFPGGPDRFPPGAGRPAAATTTTAPRAAPAVTAQSSPCPPLCKIGGRDPRKVTGKEVAELLQVARRPLRMRSWCNAGNEQLDRMDCIVCVRYKHKRN